MTARVSPADRIRVEIDELFASRGDLGDILEKVARLGARLLLQSALQAEVTEFLGRNRYERRHGATDARDRSRNGYNSITIKTTAGPVVLGRPKLPGTTEAFAARLAPPQPGTRAGRPAPSPVAPPPAPQPRTRAGRRAVAETVADAESVGGAGPPATRTILQIAVPGCPLPVTASRWEPAWDPPGGTAGRREERLPPAGSEFGLDLPGPHCLDGEVAVSAAGGGGALPHVRTEARAQPPLDRRARS